MNKLLCAYRVLFSLVLIGVLMLLLSGCTKSHFGVSKQQWQTMSEPERLATINGYNERQRLKEEMRLAEQQRCEVQAEQDRTQRNEHIQAIYDGDRRDFGDLVRVSIKEGQVHLAGKHRQYRPVSFKIADTECKKIDLLSSKTRRSYTGTLRVCYENGVLLVDVMSRDQDYGAEPFVFDGSWVDGHTYHNIYSHGQIELKNVDVHIMVVPSHVGGMGVEPRVW